MVYWRQAKDVIKHVFTKKAPESPVPRLSFWVGLRLCIIPVQPLANIVGNYACQCGENKGNDSYMIRVLRDQP